MTDIFSDEPTNDPVFAIGDKVWVYRRGLYPIKAVVTETKALGLNNSYRVKHGSSTYSNDIYGQHEMYLRPSQKRELAKELEDDIEFIKGCLGELFEQDDEEEAA